MKYKVKDLVKELLKLDQNAVVVKTTDNFEQGQSEVEASGVEEFEGVLSNENFRDAFDGGTYTKKVVKRFSKDKNKTKFVKIH